MKLNGKYDALKTTLKKVKRLTVKGINSGRTIYVSCLSR